MNVFKTKSIIRNAIWRSHAKTRKWARAFRARCPHCVFWCKLLVYWCA
jgi:hypothetical protein